MIDENEIKDEELKNDELPESPDAVPDEPIPEQSEPEEEEQEEVAEERPKKRDARTRINELVRKNHRAVEEMKRALEVAQTLELENEQLRKLNAMTAEASFAQQEAAAKARLDRAKERKANAIEMADVKGQVDADIEIASAVSDVQKLEYDKTYRTVQDEYRRQTDDIERQYYDRAAQEPEYRPEYANIDFANEWLQENDWFVKGSPNFNPRLHAEVNRLSEQLEHSYRQSGQAYKIASPEHFDIINQQIPQIKQRLGMKPEMNRSRMYVEPVHNRGSSSAAGSYPRSAKLSSDEKDFIRRLGVSEDSYIKEKLKDQKEMKMRMNEYSQRGGY